MIVRLVLWLSIVSSVVFWAGCASNLPSRELLPARGSAAIGDSNSFLAVALDISEKIPDNFGRVYVQLRVADEYFATGQSQFGLLLLKQIDQSIGQSPQQAGTVQMRLETARVALKNKESRFAISILEPLLKEIVQTKNFQSRGTDLSTFIQVCFTDVPVTSEVLHSAVQFVYVTDDPRLRAFLLTDLAQYYTREHIGKRSTALLQQAIPAASAIANPFQKAEAFSRVASGFRSEGNWALVKRFAQNAYEIAGEQEIINLNQNDARSIRETIRNLVEVGFVAQASKLVPLIPYAQERLDSQIALVGGYVAQKDLATARRVLQQILLGSLSDPGLRLRYLARAALIFKRDSPADAINYRDQTVQLAQRLTGRISEAIKADLYRTLASAGWSAEAAPILTLIKDAYTLASLLLEHAEQAKTNQEAIAMVRRARAVALGSNYLRDALVGKVIVDGAKLGHFLELKVDLPTIKDPFIMSQTLVELFPLFPNDQLSPPSVVQLRQYIKERWGV